MLREGVGEVGRVEKESFLQWPLKKVTSRSKRGGENRHD